MQRITPIQRPSKLNELAYKEIKTLLITGRFEFDTIYSANHFADLLMVSRTPVREALLQLTSEGYLVSVQGRGFKIRGFSEKEIRDFFEARKMIETYVIERLVDVLGEEDFQHLEKCCRRMKENTDSGAAYLFLEADKNFHMTIVNRYNNLFLESIMMNIRNFISLFGQRTLSRAGRAEEVIGEHEEILRALHQKRKGEAVQAILYHLNTTEKYLLENLNQTKRLTE